MTYVLRRTAFAVLQVLAVSLASFLLLELAPGTYFDDLRTDPRISRETVEALRLEAGQSAPLLTRYAGWVASIARGECGYSLVYHAPAAHILWPRIINTLILTSAAWVVSWLIGLAFGTTAAVLANSRYDRGFQVAVATLLAVPDVLLALLFLLIAVRSGSFPGGGLSSSSDLTQASRRADLLQHLALPVVCLSLSSVPVLLAHVRAALTEVLQLPFVRVARSYGIRPLRLLVRHVLPVAANPILTLAGMSLGGLLSSSLIIEVVFGWPGLGRLFLQSVLQRDLYVVVDTVTVSSIFLMSGNLLSDLLLQISDPRIRE